MGNDYDFDERLIGLRKNAGKLLKFNFIHAPHFTLHGNEHSTTMEGYLDDFVKENNLTLNKYEDFLLRAAIWLHDLGMMHKESTDEDTNEVRKRHHKKSKSLIDSDYGRNKFSLNNFESAIIGHLAILHRKSVDIRNSCKYYKDCTTKLAYKNNAGNNSNFVIHIDKLGMILRLLDTCDRCYMRSFDPDVIELANIPEAAKYHYAHLCINSVEFKKCKIIINSQVPPYVDNDTSSTEENLVTDLVINDIKKEVDSLEWALTKYNLNPFDVEHIPNRIGQPLVPPPILDEYLLSRNTFSTSENPDYSIRSLDKTFCIFKNGHTIIDFVSDVVVNGEKGLKSIRHGFLADEGNPKDFRFRNFDLAKEIPFTKRFDEQSVFAYLIDNYGDNSINLTLKEENAIIGDPFKYREFDVDFSKQINKGTRLKYGIGLSSPNYLVLDNPDKSLNSSHFIKVPTTIFTLNLKFERGLIIDDLKLNIRDQNNQPIYTQDLVLPNVNIHPNVIFDTLEGKCTYSRENGLYYDTHRFNIHNVQTNRLIEANFKVK
ncbi:MAG: hypothetical protein KAT05_13945 [Spirochaetes bacterium]|nr:hypothetical protein [Spirochaetota bacterium]